MAKLIQICASQNDLFGLDGEGVVYQYNFNTNNWLKLDHGRGDRGESPLAEGQTASAQPRFRTALAVAILLVAGLAGALGIAHADVPTAGDIAACNRQAQEGVRGRAVSATPRDEAGADAARQAGADTVERRGTTVAVTQSGDPQIHGMEGEGAKDAAYRAAYRVCMRRSGF
jgi:hypothetical protein